MAEQETAERDRTGTGNHIGSFGWFSVAGFLIMGLLYLLDVMGIADSILSPGLTLLVAIVAGIGALLLYFGNDPTAGPG